MMDERTSRIFIGLCLLVLVWIGVYWMWQPSRDQSEPNITFEQPDASQGSVTEPPDQVPVIPSDGSGSSLLDQVTQQEPTDIEPRGGDTPTLKAPEFAEHTVRSKETMQTIARQYFGSAEKWSVIARANPFVDPQKLREGMVIRIPKDPDNIQGVVEGRETEPGVIETHTPSDSAFIEYVVRPGDSLSKISLNIYGSTRYARLIYEANRDVLKSMDDISIGQLLRLPPQPQD
jgi:nucleoid-associated protein YgaU